MKRMKSNAGWLLGMMCLVILFPGGCGPVSFTIGSSATEAKLAETVVLKDDGWLSDKIAMIDVKGLIVNSERPGILSTGENPVAALQERLERAAEDPSVKAVILRLNTPGGTVTATDAMYREVMHFKKQTGKPVVALMMDVAASGGYYLACSANEIVAYPSSVTGSIGVIMQLVSFKDVMDRVGVDATAITSGPNKDIGSPFDTLSDEQRKILQSMVDDFYRTFRNRVRAARPMISEEDFETATDGRVFTGRQAAKIGLVDQLGDLRDAFDVAKQSAGMRKGKLVLYHRAGNAIRSPYQSGATMAPPGGVQVNLAQINLLNTFGEQTPVFMYVWRPLAK